MFCFIPNNVINTEEDGELVITKLQSLQWRLDDFLVERRKGRDQSNYCYSEFYPSRSKSLFFLGNGNPIKA
jgi:hypothetical protein